MKGMGLDLSTPLWWDMGWRLSWFWLGWSLVGCHSSPVRCVLGIGGCSRSVPPFSASLSSSLSVPASVSLSACPPTCPVPQNFVLFYQLCLVLCCLLIFFLVSLYLAPALCFLVLACVSCISLLFQYSVFPSVHLPVLTF